MCCVALALTVIVPQQQTRLTDLSLLLSLYFSLPPSFSLSLTLSLPPISLSPSLSLALSLSLSLLSLSLSLSLSFSVSPPPQGFCLSFCPRGGVHREPCLGPAQPSGVPSAGVPIHPHTIRTAMTEPPRNYTRA